MKRVYFIRPVGQEGPVKIGCSEWPENRLNTLMSWSPVPLEIAATIEGDYDVEGRFHGMFRDDWTHGEWFRPSPRLSEVIARVATGDPLASVLDMNVEIPDFRDYSLRRSPAWRKWASYSHRVWRLRVSRRSGKGLRAFRIVQAWRDNGYVEPSAADLAFLDHVLAEPSRKRTRKAA